MTLATILLVLATLCLLGAWAIDRGRRRGERARARARTAWDTWTDADREDERRAARKKLTQGDDDAHGR